MRCRDESGAATVTGLMLIGVLAFIAAACALAVAGVSGHRQAQNSADLAALAGATAHQRGADPCAAAGNLAVANGADLVGCTQSDEVVTVSVVIRLAVGALGVSLPARARAGPA